MTDTTPTDASPDAPATGPVKLDPPRRPLSLQAQKEKLARVLADRAKLYDLSARKGSITAAVALEKRAELEDIALTFAFCVANADWIKAEHTRRRFQAHQARELAELEAKEAAAFEADADAVALKAAANAMGASSRVTRNQPEDIEA